MIPLTHESSEEDGTADNEDTQSKSDEEGKDVNEWCMIAYLQHGSAKVHPTARSSFTRPNTLGHWAIG
jgi:hypothetical protein